MPSDVPGLKPSPEALDAPRLPLALVPLGRLALGVDAGIERDNRDSGPRRPLGASALVAALAKETLGRGRVERGLVHPYYAQLGKALIKHWDADRVAGAGLKGFGEQMSANLRLLNDVWLERAAAFGRSGAPVEPSPAGSASGRRAAVSDQIQGISGIDPRSQERAAPDDGRAVQSHPPGDDPGGSGPRGPSQEGRAGRAVERREGRPGGAEAT